MGNGRYVKQDNGDYIHYDEDEYWSVKAVCAVITGFIMVAIGFWLGIDWWNFNDWGFIAFSVGCGFSLLGFIGLLVIDHISGINWALTLGIIFGTLSGLGLLVWYFAKE